MGILLKPTQFVWLQKLLNPQADLRKAFGHVTERLIRFCSTSWELEGLLIEYLEPKLILWHDLTHSIIIFPRHNILVIERREICPLIWKRSWSFQLSIRSTRAFLTTLNNGQITANFTACWWVFVFFFNCVFCLFVFLCFVVVFFTPQVIWTLFFVALWGYTEEMRDTETQIFRKHSLRHEQLQ